MQGKRAWILIACLVLLFAAFSAASIYIYATALKTEFAKSVEWLTHAFADEVSHQIVMVGQDEQTLQKELNIWAEKIVREYLLYAQVVKEGKALAEAKAPEAINLSWPSEALSSELAVAWKRLPDGTPYLDMLKSLEVPGNSYLRIGVSLAQLSSGIRIGALIIALAGLISIFISSFLVLYFSGLLFVSGRNAEVAPPALSTESESARATSFIKAGELFIDDNRKEVRLNGLTAKLSPREYALLKLLASEPGRVFSDKEIIEKIWPENSLASADDVRKYIRFLRRKLERDHKNPQIILTVKGFGYKLQA